MSKPQAELSVEQLTTWLKASGYVFKSDGLVCRTLYKEAVYRVSHPNFEDKDFSEFTSAMVQLRCYKGVPVKKLFPTQTEATLQVFYPKRVGIRFDTKNANDLKMLELTKGLPPRPSMCFDENCHYTLAEVEDKLKLESEA